jgi:hypothetical protein
MALLVGAKISLPNLGVTTYIRQPPYQNVERCLTEAREAKLKLLRANKEAKIIFLLNANFFGLHISHQTTEVYDTREVIDQYHQSHKSKCQPLSP